jgi:predicted nucleic acid-binding protein
MDTFLLDTTAASVLFDKLNKEHELAWSFVGSLGESRIYIPCITWGEIRYGYKVHQGVDQYRKTAIEKEMKKFKVLDISRHTSEAYSDIRAALFSKYGTPNKRGKIKEKVPEDLVDRTTGKELGIQENDLWIVALAAQNNYKFITSDKMTRLREITENLKNLWPDREFWNWRTGKIL